MLHPPLETEVASYTKAMTSLEGQYVRDRIIKLRLAPDGRLPSGLTDHVLEILKRHVQACMRCGIEPAPADRVIAEGVEDFILKKQWGEEFSVLAKLPDGFAERFARVYWPQMRLHQYAAPAREYA